MNRKTIDIETKRAVEFLFQQLKNWTVEESMIQLKQEYGLIIYTQVRFDLQEFFKKTHDKTHRQTL